MTFIAALYNKDRVFYKRLFLLALPMIIQEILNSAVNMLDTFMIGAIGLYEVTAVGLANQVFFLFSVLIFGINSGSSIFMGQFWGKKDVRSIHKTMGFCIMIGLLVAGAFFILAFCFPDTIMAIYSDGNEKVIEYGISYLRIIAVSYFFAAITACINIALKSTGQTLLPMTTTAVALITNGIFNYIFIFKLEMGVSGAALATVIARAVELVVQLILIIKLRMPVVGKIKNYFAQEKTFIRDYFKITLPVILNEAFWAGGTSLYTVIYKFTGTEGQGAVQIAGTIQNLFMVVGFGVGGACAIILSNTLGAGDREKAIEYSRKCMVLAGMISIIMGISIVLAAPNVIGLFNVPLAVKEHSKKIIYVIAITLFFKTINFTSIIGVLRSGGDTLFCLLVDGMGVWLVGIPLAFLGAKVWGLPIYFVFLLANCEEYMKFAFCIKRVMSNVWAKTIVDTI